MSIDYDKNETIVEQQFTQTIFTDCMVVNFFSAPPCITLKYNDISPSSFSTSNSSVARVVTNSSRFAISCTFYGLSIHRIGPGVVGPVSAAYRQHWTPTKRLSVLAAARVPCVGNDESPGSVSDGGIF